MLAWIHRHLPILLAALLSLLVHALVLFPAIEVLLSGPRDGTLDRASLGLANPGLRGVTRDSEADRKHEKLDERTRQAQRKLNIRRIQQEERQKPPEKDPAERKPDQPQDDPIDDEKIELGIDESDATTMNWIGYAEYEKHLAALSEVEQAALRVQSSSGSGGTASPTLPPAPPSVSVAMSPNPSDDGTPASGGDGEQEPDTTLATDRSTTPSTPAPATARTERTQPDSESGTDRERARPEPPSEENPTPAPTAPTDSRTADAASRERPTPEGPDGADAVDPSSSAPDRRGRDIPSAIARSESEAPTIPDALIRPDEEPDPSLLEPEKFLNPSNSGASEALPPRENADPESTSPIPPTEIERSEREPTVRTDIPEEREGAENRARGEDQDRGSQANDRGAGVRGPDVVQGTTAPPSAPSPAGAPGDTRADQGALSTRESDASSIIDVPMADWRNGKPLARRGIMLQTFRPRFNALNIIDGVRVNPIVELVVGRDGIPQHVVIARSSGNPGVNDAIRSSLYKWRASGKKISELAPGQTVTIRIKLILLAD
jgi:outer membrane biosynthesis protein TonB